VLIYLKQLLHKGIPSEKFLLKTVEILFATTTLVSGVFFDNKWLVKKMNVKLIVCHWLSAENKITNSSINNENTLQFYNYQCKSTVNMFSIKQWLNEVTLLQVRTLPNQYQLPLPF